MGRTNKTSPARSGRKSARASRRRNVTAPIVLGCTCVVLAAAGCSRGYDPGSSGLASKDRYDPRTGTSASERVVTYGQPVPKGGGHYKLGAPYRVSGRWYVPREEPGYDRIGLGSWYGSDFHGRRTANGEIFDMDALTAAHPTLPLPSYAYVTNMRNGRTILVRINDRGPYAHDRVIDLSRRAARELGTEQAGVAEVRVRYAGRAPLDGNDIHERRFLAAQPWYEAQPGHHAAAPPAPATPVARAWTPAPRVAADATEGGWSATSYRASLAGRR